MSLEAPIDLSQGCQRQRSCTEGSRLSDLPTIGSTNLAQGLGGQAPEITLAETETRIDN